MIFFLIEHLLKENDTKALLYIICRWGHAPETIFWANTSKSGYFVDPEINKGLRVGKGDKLVPYLHHL